MRGSIVLGAAAMISVGTYAAFQDTETLAGNTFTAGTIDLEVDGTSMVPMVFTASNPSAVQKVLLKNTGSLSAKSISFAFTTVGLMKDGNGCAEAEDESANADLECGDNDGVTPTVDETGDIDQAALNVEVYRDSDKDGSIDVGSMPFYTGPLAGLIDPVATDTVTVSEAGGASDSVQYLFKMSAGDMSNKMMTDKLTFNVDATLHQ